ncbi:hypothetical protein BKA69DRAFT_18380 [Paraphysoderma sedebokerense]|nr:hypothetical protein BKA69DRAFT_18380 [Paraphysoderma sedebokerense]
MSKSPAKTKAISLNDFTQQSISRLSSLSLTCLTPDIESLPETSPFFNGTGKPAEQRKIESLLDFPHEILTHILSFFDIVTLIKLRTVCKTFDAAVFSCSLWKDIDVQFDKNWKFAEELLSLISKCGHYSKKMKAENVRDDIVSHIIQTCPNLEELTLKKWTTLSDHAFAPLVDRSFLYLKKVTILDNGGFYSAITCQSIAALAESAPNLEELHVWCNAMLNSRAIRTVADNNPKLRVLSISSSQLLTDDDIGYLVEKCPNLSYLALSHCWNFTDSALRSIGSNAISLRSLILHGGSHLTDDGVMLLAGCPKLEYVKFFDCNAISLGVMDKLGFESVIYTPIIHRPCFKVGIGFGYKRCSPQVEQITSSIDNTTAISSSAVQINII